MSRAFGLLLSLFVSGGLLLVPKYRPDASYDKTTRVVTGRGATDYQWAAVLER